MQTALIAFLLLCFITSFVSTKLVLIHTIFRHGERTPDSFTMYPTDPYRNSSFYPYGTGQMTNEGKQTMYNLGKDLRNRYQDFIGDIYTPDTIDPWASSLPRTQMALQLVLASLFPPKGFQVWKDKLGWQPIPYHFLPKQNDSLLLGILLEDYIRIYSEYCETDSAKQKMKQTTSTLRYIREHAKTPGRTPREFFYLYITLATEHNYGLKLPQWTEKIFPQPLMTLMNLEYQMQVATKELTRITAGMLMKKILQDTENSINTKSNSKMHIYSGHDVNIAYVLILLDLMYVHAPGYGACLVVEIHEEKKDYVLKVFYKENKDVEFKLLSNSNGKDFVTLQELKKVVNNIYQNDVMSVSGVSRLPALSVNILFLIVFNMFLL